MISGSCACGAIRFTATAIPTNASACHCSQCRKMSGHVWVSAQVPETALRILGPVRWIELTTTARRGICPDCGAFLFWHGRNEPEISIALGAVDGPTGLHLQKHIFTAHKGDYYQITNDLPQRP
ncbi:GFA family protein [Thalassovita sp.]|uniref:GFA family protein n=1 Tax=Thalassovita sp. TaxID=1979401 RepID=UPI0029DE5436|nr:GFA family protein [Thalassovita sp.]